MAIEDTIEETRRVIGLSLTAMKTQLESIDKQLEQLDTRRDLLLHLIAFTENANASLVMSGKLSLDDGASATMPSVTRPKVAVQEGANQPVDLDEARTND
jgi:hypothetical protein